MPEVRALRSFTGRYGRIRTGQTFAAEPGYAAALKRNKLVEYTGKPGEPGPQKDRSIPEAPDRGGKDDKGTGRPAKSTAPQPLTGGKGITSSSAPAAPASRPRTSSTSKAGGRKGTPTPRKGKTKTSSTPPADAEE